MAGQRRFTKVLDTASWGRGHWTLFGVVSANYFLDGIMFSVAPLLLYLVAPQDVASTIFAANLLAEAAGAILLGYLADRYGRKTLFTLSLTLEVIGLLLLAVDYTSTTILLIGTSLMTFGIGGEFGAAYAAIAELSPARVRGRALLMATNFWNIGSAVMAALSLVYAGVAADPNEQARLLIMSALGTAVVAGIARLGMPESPRWLVERGRRDEAERLVRRITGYTGPLSMEPPEAPPSVGLREALTAYRFRLAVLATLTIAQYISYDLAAYYLPYAPGFKFESVENIYGMVVLVANLGASIGGFLMLPFIDKTRRGTALSSFLGGLLAAIALWVVHNMAGVSAVDLFYAVLFVNMIFSEWAWASLSVLQSELFPTGIRASVVGLLTSLQGGFGALIVFLSLRMNATIMLASITGLWLAGFIAATAWYLKGVESAAKTVEELAAPERVTG
ncbi:MAG: sugar porter family MFS transporter [Desulfurococcales archaeon]|nr:sugar porter family MFS transporter [Desulfurococcales archaeon]